MELNYKWYLKDTSFKKNRGTVFSCFSCGGGSTMGYKLAGFDVIGCNEIDPVMMAVYKKNHSPKFAYLEPIQTFKLRQDFPKELYNLDILDGSPPCSSFSMSGNRGKDWGKEKKFKEGQKEQILDTLFFDFIELAKKLQPKIVIAENVKGLLLGEAKTYVNNILIEFDKAGYYVRYDLLDAAKMGVPQKRERVFFCAIRKDLYKGEFEDMFQTIPILDLVFKEKEILFKDIADKKGTPLTALYHTRWEKRIITDSDFGDITLRTEGQKKCFSDKLLRYDCVPPTLTSGSSMVDYETGLNITDYVKTLIGSFPLDYDFNKTPAQYIIGMSVPPLMTAKVIEKVYNQWML